MATHPESERLARLEEKVERMEQSLDVYEEMRMDFTVLKARWGLVAAVIGAFFAALVGIAGKLVERWVN